ncbi:pyridoxal phosphate-dependent aminotransferase [Ornithinimicrobium avium]|uniref:pyridoxal phosphate-dependent aminotransferase n=1 Tax=Ornithinimicrobium avium TaxID=2283195 RepID=UPI00192D9ECE|nr:aminotransferase class I/II-fold pyridoxal phosphate-dependent enzyme [Ornithinimicrobium avium]
MLVSPTLAINEEIARRRAQGRPVVALGFGEASLPVHPLLVDQLARHAAQGGYGEVAGASRLREAAAGYWSRRGVGTRAEEVVAGPGSKPLLYAVFEALGGPVLLPRPSWVSYAAQNEILGQRSVSVPTVEGEGGVPDPARLDSVARGLRDAGTPATAVLVTIPDNPTGTVAAPATVRELCRVAEEHDLVVISDEIYLDLVHDPDREVLTPSQVVPGRTITTTGLSKSLALGGWRIGVARIPDGLLSQVRGRVTSVASEIWSAPAHPVQLAAAWAFAEPADLTAHIALSSRLHGRVARAVAAVFRDAGAEVAEPSGAFYLYPDLEPLRDRLAGAGVTTSPGLARVLLDEHGIATLPGAAFGDAEDRLTLRVATPMLYGPSDDQRWAALEAEAPAELPWIREGLDTVRHALDAMLPE